MELDSIVDWSKAAKSVDHEATSNKQQAANCWSPAILLQNALL